MERLKGFHEPKHIVALREQQAKEREKLLKAEAKEEKKPCKKKKKKEVPVLSDDDMGTYGYSPEDHELREE